MSERRVLYHDVGPAALALAPWAACFVTNRHCEARAAECNSILAQHDMEV
jgi:hypothetical protein